MSRYSTTLLATAALLALASVVSPASAQDGYGYGPPPDEIYVYGPRPAPERSGIGAPIETVSLSDAVRFDDLDLRTDWGAEELRERILYTASNLCRALDAAYPTSGYLPTSDSPPCYRTAVDDAMAQADAAIGRARGYGP